MKKKKKVKEEINLNPNMENIRVLFFLILMFFFGCLIRIYFLWIYKLRFIYLSFIYLNIYDYE